MNINWNYLADWNVPQKGRLLLFFTSGIKQPVQLGFYIGKAKNCHLHYFIDLQGKQSKFEVSHYAYIDAPEDAIRHGDWMTPRQEKIAKELTK